MLYPFFSVIWEKAEVPTEWKKDISSSFQKGDLSLCSTHGGITRLSIPGKDFNRVMLTRLKDAIDPHLRDHQTGLRKNRSYADQIVTLRIILEQSLQWNSSLYVNIIHHEKAFNSVDRECLWKLLRHYGIPEKTTSIIQNSYEGLTSSVMHNGQLLDAFPV